MMTYDQEDPDVVQWGLQFFESDPYSSYYGGQHFKREDDHQYDDAEDGSCNVPAEEEDALIARVLQEELLQLAVVEAPELAPDEGEQLQLQLQLQLQQQQQQQEQEQQHLQLQLQASEFQQDWVCQPTSGNYASGQEGGCREEADDMRPPSSCSSPEESVYLGEEWLCSLELMDQYAFEGEVGKWLNEMVPIPHVPRINGEIPSVDEATLDHQRLLDRLQVYDLVERKVQGDGNCQFRALSDQFYRTTEHHEFVRQQIVIQLKSHPDIYEGYVPMAYGDYLEKMSKSGEWGDHVTLQAAADSYGVKIFVITSFKDTCYIEILPNVQRSKRVILLSFWAEVHYNSIFPQGDITPDFETKKKKKWRILRNKHLESADEYQ